MKQIAVALTLMLAGCATVRESYPTRTATEQMLVSEAAESAAAQLTLSIPKDRKCFLDTTNFEGVDARYAVSAIRQNLMIKGLKLMDKRDDADTIIEVRAGALSIDSHGKTLTIPGIQLDRLIPIPVGLASPVTLNQFSRKVDEGIAKFSAFAYDKATGTLMAIAQPVEGRSRRARVSGATIIPTKTTQ